MSSLSTGKIQIIHRNYNKKYDLEFPGKNWRTVLEQHKDIVPKKLLEQLEPVKIKAKEIKYSPVVPYGYCFRSEWPLSGHVAEIGPVKDTEWFGKAFQQWFYVDGDEYGEVRPIYFVQGEIFSAPPEPKIKVVNDEKEYLDILRHEANWRTIYKSDKGKVSEQFLMNLEPAIGFGKVTYGTVRPPDKNGISTVMSSRENFEQEFVDDKRWCYTRMLNKDGSYKGFYLENIQKSKFESLDYRLYLNELGKERKREKRKKL